MAGWDTLTRYRPTPEAVSTMSDGSVNRVLRPIQAIEFPLSRIRRPANYEFISKNIFKTCFFALFFAYVLQPVKDNPLASSVQ